MAKKQLKIPFKDGDHVNGLRMFMMKNVIIMRYLTNALRYTDSFVDALRLWPILRPANDHGEDFNYAKSVYYQVFLTDSKEVIQNMMHGIIYGKWTFVKRRKILALNRLRSYLRYIKYPLIWSQRIFLGLRINEQYESIIPLFDGISCGYLALPKSRYTYRDLLRLGDRQDMYKGKSKTFSQYYSIRDVNNWRTWDILGKT